MWIPQTKHFKRSFLTWLICYICCVLLIWIKGILILSFWNQKQILCIIAKLIICKFQNIPNTVIILIGSDKKILLNFLTQNNLTVSENAKMWSTFVYPTTILSESVTSLRSTRSWHETKINEANSPLTILLTNDIFLVRLNRFSLLQSGQFAVKHYQLIISFYW
jgi:hypothetical protein